MIRAATFLILLAGATEAQSVKLQDYEIEALLTGNTAVGVWEGSQYRQYFDEDGTTIYAQDDARATLGEWRIKGEEYQSIWPNDAEWEGWFVMEYAGDFYWVNKTTPPTKFRILEGRQLVVE